MFENETFDTILERMLARFPDDVDKREGSVLRDLLSAKAAELEQAYIQMDNVINLGFASTSYGEYLDRRAEEQGIIRKQGTKASGFVTITAPVGSVVEEGTRVATNDDAPLYFVTLSEVTVGTSPVTVGVEAEEVGTNGNTHAGKIDTILGNLSGVATVTNTADFSGGTNVETDEELYDRYLQDVSQPTTSGNKHDYVKWAKSVDGISDAKVYPLWDGIGTVKVVVVDSEKRAPSATVLNAVTTYIDEMHPVGAEVTVESVAEVTIDTNAKLTLREGASIDEVRAEIYANVEAYLKSIAFTNDVVRYTGIGNAILDATGVVDYENLRINNNAANIVLNSNEVPVIGALNFTI